MKIYVVRRGDTPERIAACFGCSVKDLAAHNSLSDPSHLTPGMALLLPEECAKPCPLEINAFASPDMPPKRLAALLPRLSYISPLGCRVTESGNILAISDGGMVSSALENCVMPVLRVSNTDENGCFSSDAAHALLNDEAAQRVFFDNLFSIIALRGYRAVNLDLEYIYSFDSEAYSGFIATASAALHKRGSYLFTTVCPAGESPLCDAADLSVHARCADRVILMCGGNQGGTPQPALPIAALDDAISSALAFIPSGKLLAGITNYACSFALPRKNSSDARLMSSRAALELAVSVGAEICYDEKTQSPHFRYRDCGNVLREVYFDDARSFSARLELVKRRRLAGISIWTADRAFPQTLRILSDSLYAEKLI